MMIYISKIIMALFLAWWGITAIPAFATHINRQIYDEYHMLIHSELDYNHFQQQSHLQPKSFKASYLFFIIFPIITIVFDDMIISGLFILLVFLSVLDIAYYLTDIKVVAIIFLLSLSRGEIITLYFLVGFFGIIQIIATFLLKKEGIGMGDYLLLLALAPLFSLEQMLMLILMASLLGITYFILYRVIAKQPLRKLPFIPFITISTFIVFIARI